MSNYVSMIFVHKIGDDPSFFFNVWEITFIFYFVNMTTEIISPTFFHMNEWIVIKKSQSCSSFIIDKILNFMKQNAENLIGKILYMYPKSNW